MGLALGRVAFFVLVLAVLFLLEAWARRLLAAWARREQHREHTVRASVLLALCRTAPIGVFALGLPAAIAVLSPPASWTPHVALVRQLVITVAIFTLLFYLVDAIEAALRRRWRKSGNPMDAMLGPVVKKTARTVIFVLGAAQVIQLFSDKPVTSLIAGLGVGGLAVALAAQDTIKNFFGSLVILADKPFEIGQRVVVDGHDGTIEGIGFRSTRIRTLDGHQVTIPNGEMANRTILNIGRRPFIRRVLNLSLTYDTPPEKVERARDILSGLLKDHEGLNPEFPARVYFSDFAASSLNLMAIYWYHPADYWAYMAFTEKLNLDILRRFNAEGINFAFPSQTLYLAGDPKRPVVLAPPPGG